jgi:hypothetical protein
MNGYVSFPFDVKLEDSILMLISDHGNHMKTIIEIKEMDPILLNPDNGFPI